MTQTAPRAVWPSIYCSPVTHLTPGHGPPILRRASTRDPLLAWHCSPPPCARRGEGAPARMLVTESLRPHWHKWVIHCVVHDRGDSIAVVVVEGGRAGPTKI